MLVLESLSFQFAYSFCRPTHYKDAFCHNNVSYFESNNSSSNCYSQFLASKTQTGMISQDQYSVSVHKGSRNFNHA
ncbi:hypothetical protein FGO68_gene12161 [Halteria grandinella]|uniref:Uncharacterized protein n=1 Tax=Halteria grandinella TaxID=5974 RepID=A0A8J8NBP8_HALGN|nr:hypothetical protein FGO68_gene12161 [Halteria grandinella]